MISMIEILNEMYDFKPLKSVTGSDTQNVLTRYPMLVDFYKKYCEDSLKEFVVPSI